ncbi:carbohydrate porin [Klebsiella pneumoniae]|nr:carbohydrate porin [Klebsiella pneumoniae]
MADGMAPTGNMPDSACSSLADMDGKMNLDDAVFSLRPAG